MWKLRIYSIFYHILFILFIVILYKFSHDFYLGSKDFKKNSAVIKEEDVDRVIKPRLQVERNRVDFEYIESDYMQVLDDNDFLFENIKMKSNLGTMKAGKLDVRNDNTYLLFTKNPEFTIYLNNIKK